MFNFREEIFCPDENDSNKAKFEDFKKYYQIKYNIIQRFNPKTMVEIGVRTGYSAHTFLSAVPGMKYIGLDANNNTHGGQNGPWTWWAEKILSEAEFNFEIIETDTQNMMEVPAADFYHIDGDHTVAGVMHDLDICFSSRNPNGVLLIDDYDYIDDVREGVDGWIAVHDNQITWEYVDSLRGEIIIK